MMRLSDEDQCPPKKSTSPLIIVTMVFSWSYHHVPEKIPFIILKCILRSVQGTRRFPLLFVCSYKTKKILILSASKTFSHVLCRLDERRRCCLHSWPTSKTKHSRPPSSFPSRSTRAQAPEQLSI